MSHFITYKDFITFITFTGSGTVNNKQVLFSSCMVNLSQSLSGGIPKPFRNFTNLVTHKVNKGDIQEMQFCGASRPELRSISGLKGAVCNFCTIYRQIILPQTHIKLMLLCQKCLYQPMNKWLTDNCFCILQFFKIGYTNATSTRSHLDKTPI